MPVFTPRPRMQELFSLASIFVGYQTLDPELKGKPTVMLNSQGSWDGFVGLLEHLHEVGTVRQKVREYLQLADCPEEVVARVSPEQEWHAPEE